uniref:Uncharacterized protein n=1 Tax=Anguilla anguilla TaxID=7936 RepID=A0A0E9X308_ANGAN
MFKPNASMVSGIGCRLGVQKCWHLKHYTFLKIHIEKSISASDLQPGQTQLPQVYWQKYIFFKNMKKLF